MVAHNVYSFYSPETFLDGTLWFQHSATGQSLGLVISRKNSKNPWSHGPATSCDILRHPATASANITTASQQQTHTNATKIDHRGHIYQRSESAALQQSTRRKNCGLNTGNRQIAPRPAQQFSLTKECLCILNSAHELLIIWTPLLPMNVWWTWITD